MINIQIDNRIKEVAKNIKLGCIQGRVKVVGHDKRLWEEVLLVCQDLAESMEVADIAKSKNIKDGRAVYRSLGVDPTRYRLSSEALLRRAIKGKDLYQVNNVVDINNLISIKSMYPICTYDVEKIDETIYFTVGKEGEAYEGIGRGEFHIENFPVFGDEKGKFGSTTSDSERAMIKEDTKEILMILVAFNGDDALAGYLEEAKKLLEEYANGEDIEMKII